MVKLSLPRLPGHASPTSTPTPAWLPLIFFLPLIVGIITKILRSKYIFSEYQSVACAGLKALSGQPIYALNLQCEGMRAASFVYIPGVAQFAAFFERLLTEPGFMVLYLLLYVAAAVALVFVPLLGRKAPGHWRDKLPFAVFLSGSGFMLGNIAVILHGIVLAGVLAIEISPWLFVAAVVVTAWVKPIFLTYLMVILLLDQPLKRRCQLLATGAIAGLAPMAAFVLNGGELARQWYDLLSHYVYDVTPGVGFFGWLELVGINSAPVGAKLAYLVFAGLMTLSGLVLARSLKLNTRERLWLGLSLAVLLIPRIMAEDMALLGPGLLIVANRAAERATKYETALKNAPGIVFALCAVALAGALTGLADYSEPVILLGFSLFILWLGARFSNAPFRLLALRLTMTLGGARKSGSTVN
ncbi:MAG: hypothetical protein QM647_07730 [Asticcacaulis sp.]|uniref:hypothetical protein n=1 Tax=Asticcacaulis sp. TaxID=1872648 RepID=UPI0039E656C6